MLVQLDDKVILRAIGEVEAKIRVFSERSSIPMKFSSTMIGELGELAVEKWAREHNLSPIKLTTGPTYSQPDLIVNTKTVDVKAKTAFAVEKKWFYVDPNAMKRIVRHSERLIFVRVNAMIDDNPEKIRNCLKMGFSADVLGWLPTIKVSREGLVSQDLYKLEDF